jgi:imidazole glycerol-phosphate synthase subunit HisH
MSGPLIRRASSLADVVVIDYGVGNLLSVRRALEHEGATVAVTPDPRAILHAPRVVLPGVGAFSRAMAELRRLGLDDVVSSVATQGVPLLGICLGMQLLLDQSEEFGTTRGLGLIPGHVMPIPSITPSGERHKVPRVGWNPLVISGDGQGWQGTPMQDVHPGDAAYFSHSFMATPADPCHSLAEYDYDGVRIPAVIARDKVIGCQFHPEKSGDVGLKILRRFLQS